MLSMKSLLVLVPVFGLTGAIHADELSYTYGEAGYARVMGETGDVDFDGGGIGLSGSFAFTESLFAIASYGHTKVDFNHSDVDADFDSYQVGVGAHLPLQDNLDVVGTLSWVKVDAEDAGNDNGLNVGLGLRGMVTEQVEWGAGIDYTDIDDEGDYGFNVSGRYHFTPAFSVGLAVSTDDNADVFTTAASARLELR